MGRWSSVVLIALIFFITRYPFHKDQNLLEAASGAAWVVFPILLGNAVIYGGYARRRYHWHNGEDGIGPRVPEPEEPEDPID